MLIGLAVLAVLAVVAIVVGDADDGGDEASSTTTTTTAVTEGPPVPAPGDEEVAATLLPAVSALGPDWIETARDDAATSVEPSGGTCPSGPVPQGFLIHSEQRRVVDNETVQSLSVTAGVATEGIEPPSLEDDAVIECLHDALASQVADGATVESVADMAVGPGYAGAVVSHQRYQVTGDDARGGTFDFVLVRRGRLVSLGLLTGTETASAEQLSQLVLALDQPLSRAAG